MIIVYCLFVLGIVYLLFRSSRERMDLVTSDYYAEELKFQNRINEHENAARLSAPLQIENRNDSLTVGFPAEFNGKQAKGEIVFYYPADKRRDVHLVFETASGQFRTKVPEHIKGQHELHISWSAGGVNYYFEQKIFF